MYPEGFEKIRTNFGVNFKNLLTGNDDLVNLYFYENFMVGTHFHDFFEINVIANGEGIHCIEDRRYEVKKGDIFVIPPYVNHNYSCKANLNVFHIVINRLFFDEFADQLEQLPGYVTLFNIEPLIRIHAHEPYFLRLDEADYDELYKILEQLCNICGSNAAERGIMKNAYMLYLIANLSFYYRKYYSLNDSKYKNNNYIQFMTSMEIIYQNYDQKITISTLANSINMSRSAYLRLFQKILHCSPNQFIIKYRLSKSKSLLNQTDFSLTEIAQQTGFFDSSHFTRAFHHFEGVSPSQYRKSVHN